MKIISFYNLREISILKIIEQKSIFETENK